MNIFMSILLMLFTVGVFFLAKLIVKQFERNIDIELEKKEKLYRDYEEQKNKILLEKRDLESENIKIFTLYEITKEITKSLNETQAFETFKTKLRKHITFEDCRLLDHLSSEDNEFTNRDNYYLFTLQGEGKNMGYLAIKGLNAADKEKFIILGHQFSLAFRRVKLYQEIEKLAMTDSLTEVFTRRHFFDRFKEEVSRSTHRKMALSFLMIDVDFFKKYNDEYGHQAGDQILKAIASIIKGNIREIDIAGRFGGEEFCVVLPDTDRQGAMLAAERIRQAAEKAAIKAYDTTIQATVSIGLTTFPHDAKEMHELVDKADWALYRAKKMGRNRVCAFGVYDKKV